MASKRNLKKTVNYICSELFAECVANSLYNGKTDDADTEAMLQSIVAMHKDFICRISHIEPGMSAKKYFADFTAKFNEQISEIIDQIAG